MSWDLIYFKGAPDEAPSEVWAALSKRTQVQGLRSLSGEDMRVAFEEEFGDRVSVEVDDDYEGTVQFFGRGWEARLSDGDKYLHLVCDHRLAKDDAWLMQIVRAGLRAGCYVFDPQSEVHWPPVDADWQPEHFDVWDAAQEKDD